jgi:hypothetical protein
MVFRKKKDTPHSTCSWMKSHRIYLLNVTSFPKNKGKKNGKNCEKKGKHAIISDY